MASSYSRGLYEGGSSIAISYVSSQVRLTTEPEYLETFPKTEENPYQNEALNFLTCAVAVLRLKKLFHRMYPSFFHDRAFYGWASPHSFQFPDLCNIYAIPNAFNDNDANVPARGPKDMELARRTKAERKRHLDIFRRQEEATLKTKHLGPGFSQSELVVIEEKCLDPIDGRLANLIVQGTKMVYDGSNSTTWRRTYMENVSPYIVRLAYWPFSRAKTFDKKPWTEHWKEQQYFTYAAIRWLPACIGLLLAMIYPTEAEGQVRNNGFYDPFPYRFWCYMRVASNLKESRDKSLATTGSPAASTTTNQSDHASRCPSEHDRRTTSVHTQNQNRGTRSMHGGEGQTRVQDCRNAVVQIGKAPMNVTRSTRRVRKGWPRRLNFLNERDPTKPAKLQEANEQFAEVSYVFISYTALQFARACKKKCTNCQMCANFKRDQISLHAHARIATVEAKAQAYWIDTNCMPEGTVNDDVYDICDMVRNAKCLVVVLGQLQKIDENSCNNEHLTNYSGKTSLQIWGTRMWCWPEVFLANPKHDIKIYDIDQSGKIPRSLSKTQFCNAAFEDLDTSLSILDHLNNSQTLSRLEFVTLALQALLRREKGTSLYSQGDLVYALMGFLRQRPTVDHTDTAFQAFARLSLANDSDRLLERIICVLPKDPEVFNHPGRHYWATLDDHFDAKLWDIEPYIQIAGIGHDDTVIIDGAMAATIHWNSFHRVAITTKETMSRLISRTILRAAPGYFFGGILALAFRSTALGVIFLTFGIMVILLSPILILHIYGGKVWSTQPWLLGFEGHMKIEEIETMIFGFPSNRLTWAPFGSSLSVHKSSDEFLNNECRGIDPIDVLEESFVENLAKAEFGKQRLFTLVDTNTMTVFLFTAVRPPVVALLCASEGGMQRAVLCSYHWPSQTLNRETVIRMETRMLEKLSRVGRVAVSFRRGKDNRKEEPQKEPQEESLTVNINDSERQVPNQNAVRLSPEVTAIINWKPVYEKLGFAKDSSVV